MIQVPVTHKINHLLNFLLPQSSSILLNLCKLCAIFLALATFHTIFILKFRKKTPSISPFVAEYDYTVDGDDDDDTCSLSSTPSESEDEDEEEMEEENRTSECFRYRSSDDGDGGFLSSCRSIGDMFSLSEITNSKSVVKLWDSLGFGLGFGLDDCDSSYDGGIVAAYGAEEKLNAASSEIMDSAVANASRNLALSIWDTRVRRRIPAIIGEWAPGIGKSVGFVSGGVEKVYVRDDGRYELTVGNMRKYVTESQQDLWWPNSYMLKI
ncbi:unnamed protein product [Lathyrus sativus]|nr:unnamed protein product [Lathyrus sativus]